MNNSDLVAQSSSANTPRSPARWRAYLNERFPVLTYALLVAGFYSANHCFARVSVVQDQPITIDWSCCLGVVVVFCFFLHLRIFDDQKDYQQDCLDHPNRVVQRGLVSMNELKSVAAVLIVLELACGLLLGGAALVSVALCVGFSILMRWEFFQGSWLKRHQLAYAASHMLVIPLLALLTFSFSTGRHLWFVNSWFLLYAAARYFLTFNAEVSRKIHAPQQETASGFKYTKQFGIGQTAAILLSMRLAEIALFVSVALAFKLHIMFFIILAIMACLYLAAVVHFWKMPGIQTEYRLRKAGEIYMVIFDWAWIGGLSLVYGVRFSAGIWND